MPVGAKWRVEKDGSDWGVTRNGRSFGFGYSSREEAIRAVKRSRRFVKGDKIIGVEETGSESQVR